MFKWSIDGKKATQRQWYEHLENLYLQQQPYAELGRLVIEEKNKWAELMCDNNGKFKMRDDECCEYEDKDCGCQWYNICRKESELLKMGVE